MVTRRSGRLAVIVTGATALIVVGAVILFSALGDEPDLPDRPVEESSPAPPTPTRPTAGFRGDPAALRVIAEGSSLPSGTGWDSGALVVTADALTLENVRVKGAVEFRGRGTLVVRDSIIEGGYGAVGVVMAVTPGSVVDIRNSLLRWREGDTPKAGSGVGAIQVFAQLTVVAIGNEIFGTVDGIQAAGDDTRIEGNWIHDLALLGEYPNNSHNDGIQVYSGANVVVASNRVEMGFDGVHQNAAVFFQPGRGSAISRPQIRGNYLEGGGFTLRLEGATSDAVVSDNLFGPLANGAFGYAYALEGATIAEWTNNRVAGGGLLPRP